MTEADLEMKLYGTVTVDSDGNVIPAELVHKLPDGSVFIGELLPGETLEQGMARLGVYRPKP